MQLEGSEGGLEGREGTGQGTGLVGHMEDLGFLTHPPTHPPKMVGALQGWLEAEKGCDLTQVLTGALWWLMWEDRLGFGSELGN